MDSSKFAKDPGQYIFHNNFQLSQPSYIPFFGACSVFGAVSQKTFLTSEINYFKIFILCILFETLVVFFMIDYGI